LIGIILDKLPKSNRKTILERILFLHTPWKRFLEAIFEKDGSGGNELAKESYYVLWLGNASGLELGKDKVTAELHFESPFGALA